MCGFAPLVLGSVLWLAAMPAVGQAPAPAGMDCPADRRCRLRALRDQGRAIREARAREAGVGHARLRADREALAAQEAEATRDRLRGKRPVVAALFATDFGPGVRIGYALSDRVRIGGALQYWSDYYVDDLENEFYRNRKAWVFGADATYFVLEGSLSPLVSLGFFVLKGLLEPDFAFDSDDRSYDIIYHYLRATAGLAYQFRAGFFASLALVGRALLYAQSWDRDTGAYDPRSRSAITNDFAHVGVEVTSGWAW
jgi:hypothetical protein